MFARVTTTKGSPDKVDESIRHVREETLPAAKKLGGFKGMYLLVDRKTGNDLAITLWETEADLKASTEAANRLRAQATQAAGATQPPKVDIYEIAIQL
jgi:heme-degrading monooxygenase HmoA